MSNNVSFDMSWETQIKQFSKNQKKKKIKKSKQTIEIHATTQPSIIQSNFSVSLIIFFFVWQIGIFFFKMKILKYFWFSNLALSSMPLVSLLHPMMEKICCRKNFPLNHWEIYSRIFNALSFTFYGYLSLILFFYYWFSSFLSWSSIFGHWKTETENKTQSTKMNKMYKRTYTINVSEDLINGERNFKQKRSFCCCCCRYIFFWKSYMQWISVKINFDLCKCQANIKNKFNRLHTESL